MKFRKLAQIDYSLYFPSVGFITIALSSLLLIVFLYMGWETEKYPIGKILVLLYLFAFITVLYMISIAIRFFRIRNILKAGQDEKAEIIRSVKVKNDNIKIYLKATERGFICSLRRSRKNKNTLDNEFNEGDFVDIKHYRNKAILSKYDT